MTECWFPWFPAGGLRGAEQRSPGAGAVLVVVGGGPQAAATCQPAAPPRARLTHVGGYTGTQGQGRRAVRSSPAICELLPLQVQVNQ